MKQEAILCQCTTNYFEIVILTALSQMMLKGKKINSSTLHWSCLFEEKKYFSQVFSRNPGKMISEKQIGLYV